MKITDLWEGNYAVPIVLQPENSEHTVSSLENVQVSGMLGASVPLRQIGALSPQWNESVITHRNGIRSLSVLADVKRDAYPNKVFSKVRRFVDSKIAPQLPANMEYEYGGLDEMEGETMSKLYVAMTIAFVIMFFVLVFHFCKLKLAVIIMLSAALSIFGAAFGVWILRIDFSAFAILGIIGLAGIIIRNGIIMYDYIEHLRFDKNQPVREAAFEAGKRRMRPVFLTSAVAAMGVLPMIISGSPMWMGLATIIFFGMLISMVFVVTVLPVVYWKVYEK
jgi:multidrug efflux pump subunit AcrB